MYRILVALAAMTGVVAGRAEGQESCAGKLQPRGDLGVIINADATVNSNPSAERPWRFRSPLVVARVIPGGPAEGKLRQGDKVTEVDGLLVTSSEGARRLAGLVPGESVAVRISRGSRVLDRSIVTRAICPGDPDAIGSYAPRPVMSRSSRGVPVPTLPDLEPEGWLGLALACSQCGWAREAGDSAPYWESSTYPVVHALAPEGPAERAGIRVGDTLVSAGGAPVTTATGGRALGATQPGRVIELTIRRDGRTHQLAVTPTVRSRSAVQGDRRYAGVVAGARVEVAAPSAVPILVEEEGDGVVVRAGQATVRVAPERSTPAPRR